MARTRRPGFTLVEMLVVMGLIVLLAGIGVAVSESGAFGSQKVVSGADRVSGWLLIAKQRALRDARPRGVRFLLADDPTRPGVSSQNDYRNFSFVAKEAHYIEAPDAWACNPNSDLTGLQLVLSVQTGPLTRRAFITTNRATSAQNTTDAQEIDQRVAPGDLLVYDGASYRITGVSVPSGAPALRVGTTDYPGASGTLVRELTLEVFPDFGAANSGTVSNPPQGTIVTTRFAIQGQARPLVGEPLLQLTGNTVVDVRSKCYVAPFGTVTMAPPPGMYTCSNTNPTPSPAAWPATTLGVRLQPTECMVPPGFSGAGSLPQYFDILFAPSGQVLNTDQGVIALWVRDPDKTDHPLLKDAGGPAATKDQYATGNPGAYDPTVFDAAGEQVLVVVSPRTGLIATQPVTKGSDPHAAAKDGINSGL